MKKSIPRVTISKAHASEAQAIRNLEKQVWHEEVTNKYDIPMFVRFGYAYVAKYNDKIIGAIIAFRTNQDEIYISDLVVHKKYRRLKIGERLYRRLLVANRGTNVVSFLDPKLIATLELHKKLRARIIARIEDPYDLKSDKSLESGLRLLVKIKN